MNWRKDIYTKICEALQPLKDDEKLMYVDFNKGQFDEPQNSYPVARPAVLISIAESETEHMTRGWLEGTATISLYLILDNRHNSFVGAQDYTDSLEILDLIDDIVNHVVFTCGDTFDAISYDREERLPYEFDGLQKHLMGFSTQLHYQLKKV